MNKLILKTIFIFCLCILTMLTVSCRGNRSAKPPVHLNPNMDFQSKITAQDDPLLIPEHSVPWGTQSSFFDETGNEKYYSKKPKYTGKNSNGKWISKIPILVNEDLIKRGQNRYNIYCSTCHTKTGNGLKSVITQRGWIVPNINLPVTRARKDGELYDIVTNGIRLMPGYGKKLSINDRWAIVSYVRALQMASEANIANVPKSLRNSIKD
ncbi:quinol:cytochrome C oxidoreductase [Candidatus Marinamargulisbacteria bacterium SCGC AG-410-N11]|nr:quinol:cytochrome C oxidoreductase [Candidatus Marinamargulisbacteria bacterium SCGC AG-410-N11]